jgi:hypothetical protein
MRATFSAANQRGRHKMEEVCIGGMLILKRILRKKNARL